MQLLIRQHRYIQSTASFAVWHARTSRDVEMRATTAATNSSAFVGEGQSRRAFFFAEQLSRRLTATRRKAAPLSRIGWRGLELS
jgi:hypothetical protein